MTVSLIGGPLDGALSEGLSHLPAYMIATSHSDKPVYKRACCANCEKTKNSISYVFVGYDDCEHDAV